MPTATTQHVTMHGKPLELTGNEVHVGDKAPDFEVIDTEMNPVRLSDLKAKVVVISAVPSLDTPVCNLETRRFSKEATKLSNDDVQIITVSADLPFAQKRWCEEAKVQNVQTLSDHRDGSFGRNYGVMIKDLRLLARCVFVLGPDRRIEHIERCEEITNEPNYDHVLEAIARVSGK